MDAVLFYFADITKALLVSELGSDRDPEVIKTVLSNMQRLLSIPIHGYSIFLILIYLRFYTI